MVIASNDVNCLLLQNFFNLYLFLEFRKGLCWKQCKYMEWMSFSGFMGEWIGARNKQIVREPCDSFVSRSNSFPHEPRKKDTHSLKIQLNDYEFITVLHDCSNMYMAIIFLLHVLCFQDLNIPLIIKWAVQYYKRELMTRAIIILHTTFTKQCI